ncbi:hypothetical protein BJ170DRAFT_222982 [Xylariales sp. AK1849]|nr:hypothetical protein BJ170DRAFT_222982 [Xylariales sp. AK1849]
MTSNPEWGERTSGLEVAKVFAEQVRDRVVVITGVAPNGIGESTAIAIASQNPSVLVLASRTRENLEASASKIRSTYPHVDIKIVILDLASQDIIRKAASEIITTVPNVDLLINNAGAVTGARQWTKEGIEIQFGANHIGHFLFTKLLMPLLETAARDHPAGATRIINLTSQGHRLSPVRFHDYNIEDKEIPPEEEPTSGLPAVYTKAKPDGYLPLIAYGQSKTANLLFTVYLQEHLKSRGIASYAVHPGGINTNLGREHDEETAAAIAKTSKYWKTLDEGASTTLVAALDPKLNENTGLYLLDCQFGPAAPFALDPVTAARLWKLSEELTSVEFK